MAYQTLTANKLRSFLSVAGISIGIFSIVMVLTLIDSLENQIKESLSSLGKSVVYVEVFPWDSEDRKEYPWWKYMSNPTPDYKEMQALQSLNSLESVIDYIAIKAEKYDTKVVYIEEGITLTQAAFTGISNSFHNIQEMPIEGGRYFTEQEFDIGSPVVVLGYEVAKKLFKNPENALNQKVRIDGYAATVIGYLTYEGEGILSMGEQRDETLYSPIRYFYNTGLKPGNYNEKLIVKAKETVSVDYLAAELKGAMRKIRRISPTQDDNFALNKVTFLINYIRDFFAKVNIFGFIIGGFSLVVGGFGVANIMFVSVKERTSIIGVQMALGAKSQHILQQFLTESVLLSIAGGVVGILTVSGLALAANILIKQFSDLQFTLMITYSNLLIGIGFSFITGILAGIIPALHASSMVPVEAIRSN